MCVLRTVGWNSELPRAVSRGFYNPRGSSTIRGEGFTAELYDLPGGAFGGVMT